MKNDLCIGGEGALRVDGGSSPPPTLRKAYREKEGVLGVLTAVLMKQGRFV